MNKKELVDFVASSSGITKTQAGSAVSAVLEAVKTTLKNGDKLALIGFGTFSVQHRPERTGVKPGSKTGEKMTYPAKNVVKFKPGKDLETAVNE